MENRICSYKNIIWDWNGTIVNDAWVFVSIMNVVLQQNQLPPTTLEHYRKSFCFPVQDYWRGLGFRFTEETFNRLNATFIAEYQKKMFLPYLHEGLEGLFKILKKQKLQQFVLSASENTLLKRAVKHYHLESFFNGVFGVNNLNAVGKEQLGRFLCDQHNLLSSETLFIGDTEYDCKVAKSLCCGVVLISHGHINHQRLLKTGEKVVASVEELKEYLEISQ